MLMINCFSQEDSKITVSNFNQMGLKVYSVNPEIEHNSNDNILELDLSSLHLTDGLYIITINNGSEYLVKKFCKY